MPAVAADVERAPVRYHINPTEPAARDGTGAAVPSTSALNDLAHVVVALAIVIGLIFGLRYIARRASLVPAAGKAGRGVRLLSRTVLSPRQQVLLLQVGRRVLVVGDGGAGGMRPLCEITDPDEVAGLIGEARSAESARPAGRSSFGALFRRASEPFADADPFTAGPDVGREVAAASTDPDANVPPDVAGLISKVRGVRQQFDR